MRTKKGVYFLANDRVIDLAVAFLNSFRKHNPLLPLCLVPYDANIGGLLRLQSAYRFSLFPDTKILEACDGIGSRFHDFPPGVFSAGHYRKLALWEGPFDEFLYIDIDTVVLAGVEFVFPLLSEYEFIAGNSDVLQMRPFVWKDSILGANVLTGRQISYAASTGVLASKKEALRFDGMLGKIGAAVRLAPHMELRCVEQPLLNYLITTSGKRYTSLFVLALEERHRQISLEMWAGTEGGIVDSGRIAFGNKNVLLVHWAGYFRKHGAIDCGAIPYRELWSYYREMDPIRQD